MRIVDIIYTIRIFWSLFRFRLHIEVSTEGSGCQRAGFSVDRHYWWADQYLYCVLAFVLVGMSPCQKPDPIAEGAGL